MNKLKFLLMVMLAVLAFTACEDKDDENKEPSLPIISVCRLLSASVLVLT